jgi:hypothetical protein
MFGTFQEEKDDEEIVYGLVEQVKSFNPLYLEVSNIFKLKKKTSEVPLERYHFRIVLMHAQMIIFIIKYMVFIFR